MTVELTAETFDEFIRSSELPVLVDFWAPWCGPCKLIGPTIDYLSQQENRLVTFAKVDVDKYPEMSVKYGFSSVPALILFRGGNMVKRIKPQGYSSKSIEESIRTTLAEREL